MHTDIHFQRYHCSLGISNRYVYPFPLVILLIQLDNLSGLFDRQTFNTIQSTDEKADGFIRYGIPYKIQIYILCSATRITGDASHYNTAFYRRIARQSAVRDCLQHYILPQL